LPVEVNSCKRISIIAAYDTIWIHTWNQNESIETSQVFGFSLIRCKEIIYAFKCKASWCLTWMNSRRNEYNLILLQASLIPCNDYLVQRHATQCFTEFKSLVINQSLLIINHQILLKLILPQLVQTVLFLIRQVIFFIWEFLLAFVA